MSRARAEQPPQAFGLGLNLSLDRPPVGLESAIERRTATATGSVTQTLDIAVAPERRRPGYWTVSIGDGGPIGHANDVDSLASFITDLFHEELFSFCQRRNPPLLLIHAGVVAVDGRAIVMPGASMSGKSSLVAALVDLGATYLSDEYAPIDREGRVWPYARPIALRSSGGTERPTPAPGPPPGTATGPARVALIVDTQFETEIARAGRWEPAAIRGAAAILPLLAQSAGVRDQPSQSLEIAGALANVPLLRGARGEAIDAARELLRILRSTPMVTHE